MRVHSRVLTESDILTAALEVGVIVHRLTKHGSRSHGTAYAFYLEGNGSYGGQWGHHGEKSATWDEWGRVIGLLYTKDPDAKWDRVYENAEHFHWATGNRFVGGKPISDNHYRHKWAREGLNATRKYYVAHCAKCTAMTRTMAPPHKFADLG